MDGKFSTIVVVVRVRFASLFLPLHNIIYTLSQNTRHVSISLIIQTCHVGSIWTYLTGMYESYGWC